MSKNRSYTNFTVQWQATPNLPLAYNATGNEHCKHGLQDTDVDGVMLPNDWNEPVADSDIICQIGNVSYVYPCCQAIGLDARFTCHSIVCRVLAVREDQWDECAVKLAAQVGDKPPFTQCQPASVMNRNREPSEAAPRVPGVPVATIIPLAIVVLLAAVAAVP